MLDGRGNLQYRRPASVVLAGLSVSQPRGVTMIEHCHIGATGFATRTPDEARGNRR